MSDLLTFPEVAASLHVSDRTARRLAAAGRLDSVRVSPGCIRVRAESVDALRREGLDAKPRQDGAAA
jgi:excisionase family DNA binding protein